MTWWRSWRMPSLVSETSWMPAAFYSQEVPRGNKCRCVSWADGSCTVSQLNRCVGGLMGVVKICHPQSATFPKSALSTQIPPILSNSWIQKHHKKPPSSYFRKHPRHYNLIPPWEVTRVGMSHGPSQCCGLELRNAGERNDPNEAAKCKAGFLWLRPICYIAIKYSIINPGIFFKDLFFCLCSILLCANSYGSITTGLAFVL